MASIPEKEETSRQVSDEMKNMASFGNVNAGNSEMVPNQIAEDEDHFHFDDDHILIDDDLVRPIFLF